MFKNTKLYGTILGIIMFIILIAGLTYAYITWQSSNIKISTESECFVVNYVQGQNISGKKLAIINEKDVLDGNNIKIADGMALTTIGLGINPLCNITGNATIKLDVSILSDAFIEGKGNSVGALKYKIVEYSSDTFPNVTTDILKGNYFKIIKSGAITAKEEIILYNTLINSATNEYIIIFYLDEVIVQNDAAGASFYGTISAEVVQNG